MYKELQSQSTLEVANPGRRGERDRVRAERPVSDGEEDDLPMPGSRADAWSSGWPKWGRSSPVRSNRCLVSTPGMQASHPHGFRKEIILKALGQVFGGFDLGDNMGGTSRGKCSGPLLLPP
mmetsp:Transcript_39690/g.91744  ORF Transcript_39690/g.91744 Transcript_39690/m.91744 type:complete len:121 (-) Transcript_39690:195-557(-)